jgi:hypothetical protein
MKGRVSFNRQPLQGGTTHVRVKELWELKLSRKLCYHLLRKPAPGQGPRLQTPRAV